MHQKRENGLRRNARILLLFLACLVLAGCCAGARAEGGENRKLTLMVYLCGSNLESAYGSASADIEEMLAAETGEELSVLVMAGGSKAWLQGYDPAQLSIQEISGGRQRTVWHEESRSMGEREQLTTLLRYGAENYPAESYALILWDHGGGPLEGVCWDELFSMDHLSLKELTEALEAAELPGKLSWIGFDACLMSSLEVANAMAPYAEYMIASQETEPAFGWDYSFLSDVGGDGAEAGRTIIDRYFAGREESREVLTLSCVNLQGTAAVAEAMDGFFTPLGESLTRESFRRLSEIRMRTVSFGEGVKGTGADGYDLVDARDLVLRLGENSEEALRIRDALEAMTVYSRANREGVHGISLYHPYVNKVKYREQWQEDYGSLGFSAGYAQYIDLFGGILTDAAMADWSGLDTQPGETAEDGILKFESPLTQEQAEQYAFARLMIMTGGVSAEGWPEQGALIYAGPAEIGGDGTVRGEYLPETLWARDGQGNRMGPVSYLLTEDAEYRVVTAVYAQDEYEEYPAETVRRALLYLDAKDRGPVPEILRRKAYDEATQSYTSRLGIREEDYEWLHLKSQVRSFPGTGENGAIPGFVDWPETGDSSSMVPIPLSEDWAFEITEGFSVREPCFAFFQITDLQQNTWCSRPVLIENPNLIRLIPEEDTGTTQNAQVKISAYRDPSEGGTGIRVYAEITNLTGQASYFTFSGALLNGSRRADCYGYPGEIGPGETKKCRIDIREEDLKYLQEISGITLILNEPTGEGYMTKRVNLSFSFLPEPNSGGAAEETPELARKEQNQLIWRLLGIREEADGSLDLTLHVRNKGNRTADLFTGGAAVNGIQLETSWQSGITYLEGGEDMIVHQRLLNRAAPGWSGDTLLVRDETGKSGTANPPLRENVLQSFGVRAAEQIVLFEADDMDVMFASARLKEGQIELKLAEPFPLKEAEEGAAETEELKLFENGQAEVRLSRALVADNGAGFALTVRNKTKKPLLVEIKDPAVQDLTGEMFMYGNSFVIGAGATRILCEAVAPTGMEPGTPVYHFSFGLVVGQQKQQNFTIRLNTPAETGVPGGTWIEAAGMTAE